MAFPATLRRTLCGEPAPSDRQPDRRQDRDVSRFRVLRTGAAGPADRVGGVSLQRQGDSIPGDQPEVEALPSARHCRAAARGRRAPGAGPRQVDRAMAGVHEDDDPGAGQLFIVRLVHDEVTISADSSGDLLHRRGYRLAGGKAPFRETLAAGMLLAAGYDGSQAADRPPLRFRVRSRSKRRSSPGGSRRAAPGASRSSTGPISTWPRGRNSRLARRAKSWPVPRPRSWVPTGTPGAIEGARGNAVRARVADDIVFRAGSVSALETPPGPGFVVTNPPYGHRVGRSCPVPESLRPDGERAPGPLSGMDPRHVVGPPGARAAGTADLRVEVSHQQRRDQGAAARGRVEPGETTGGPETAAGCPSWLV